MITDILCHLENIQKQSFEDFVIQKYSEYFKKELLQNSDEKEANNDKTESMEQMILKCTSHGPTQANRHKIADWVYAKYINNSTKHFFKDWEHFIIEIKIGNKTFF